MKKNQTSKPEHGQIQRGLPWFIFTAACSFISFVISFLEKRQANSSTAKKLKAKSQQLTHQGKFKRLRQFSNA